MKSIAIRDQQINLLFTPGPWDNFIHGHVTSRTNGKIIARLVGQDDQPMTWAFNKHPHLRVNTQLLISLAPTMLGLLVQLLEFMSQPHHLGVFSVSKDLQAKLEAVVLLASGGAIDTNEETRLSMFMHNVALDQSLVIDHLQGPWHSFGSSQVRYKQLYVADVAPGAATNVPWAAAGNDQQIFANRQLITMTLPLAAGLTMVAHAFNTDRVGLLSAEGMPIVQQLMQITSRISVPHLTKIPLAA